MNLRNFLILFFCLNLSLTFSQEKTRLSEIDNEITIALEKEDFELASVLKKEKELRLEIKVAVSNSNFDLASSTKEKVEDIEKYLALDNLIAQALSREDYSIAEELKVEKSILLTRIDNNWRKDDVVISVIEKEGVPILTEEPIKPKHDYFGVKPGRKKSYGSMDLTMGYALIDFDDHDFFV